MQFSKVITFLSLNYRKSFINKNTKNYMIGEKGIYGVLNRMYLQECGRDQGQQCTRTIKIALNRFIHAFITSGNIICLPESNGWYRY